MQRLPGLLILALAVLPLSAAGAAEGTEIEWYGKFKLDAAYDTAQPSHTNFAMWVKEHADGDAQDVTNITARESRLGFRLKREEVRGLLEFDFYGGGAENKNLLQLRKAYVDLPLGGLRLRAGQDSDLISPLVAATLNYTVVWGNGNIGYRRPQIRLYQQAGAIWWGVALARNISPDLDGNGIADGDDGLPSLQARLALSTDIGGRSLQLGASGHYGRAEIATGGGDSYSSWSANGEAKLQLAAGATMLGEVYIGSNVGTYFGSIVNTNSIEGLASLGGWINLQLPAGDTHSLSLGAGLDTVDEDDLIGVAGARSSDLIIFGNLQRVLAPGVKGGVEIAWLTTDYPNAGVGRESKPTDLRLQFSVIGSF